jgi:hypothetical protein
LYRSASETLGFIKPELPTLVPEPPAGEGWIRGGPSRNWLKIKNMVESEFVLLGTEVDDSGIPRAILARSRMDSWSSRAGDFASPATAEWAGQAIVNVDRESGIEGVKESQ